MERIRSASEDRVNKAPNSCLAVARDLYPIVIVKYESGDQRFMCSDSESDSDDEDISYIPKITSRYEKMFSRGNSTYSVQGNKPNHVELAELQELMAESNFCFEWKQLPNPNQQVLCFPCKRKTVPPESRKEHFSTPTGPTTSFTTHYEAFVAIWNDKIMEHIVIKTNKYARRTLARTKAKGLSNASSNPTAWINTDIDELYVYFAILLEMGRWANVSVKNFWLDERVFSGSPYLAEHVMRYNRFILLDRFLRFSDSRVDISHLSHAELEIYEVDPIIAHLNQKFQDLFQIGENIVLDNKLTKWHGCYKDMFGKNEGAYFGIKICELWDGSGYLWRFDLYTQVTPTFTTPSMILNILRDLEHKGHKIWIDDVSPVLARTLKSLGFDCVGPLRADHQLVPKLCSSNKAMKLGKIRAFTSGDVDIVVWKHWKRRVAMISTYHGNETRETGGNIRPTAMHDYDINMRGMDKKDRVLCSNPIEKKGDRAWYKKFFKRLLTVSFNNSYLLYKISTYSEGMSQTMTTFEDFRHALLIALLVHHLKSNHQCRNADAQYGESSV